MLQQAVARKEALLAKHRAQLDGWVARLEQQSALEQAMLSAVEPDSIGQEDIIMHDSHDSGGGPG